MKVIPIKIVPLTELKKGDLISYANTKVLGHDEGRCFELAKIMSVLEFISLSDTFFTAKLVYRQGIYVNVRGDNELYRSSFYPDHTMVLVKLDHDGVYDACPPESILDDKNKPVLIEGNTYEIAPQTT